jgi:hypothetical protein
MNLKTLTNTELDTHVKTLAEREREMAHDIILSVKEVFRRRYHLEAGYSSLYAYLTKEAKYSEGNAQRYIDAAKLSNEVPELENKIESGEISLSHATLIQKVARQVEHDKKESLTAEVKQDLIKKISNTTVKKAKLILAQALDLKIKEDTVLTPQSDESQRLEITMTKSQHEKMQQVREYLSHLVPDGDLAKLHEFLYDKVIAVQTKKPGTATVAANKSVTPATRRDIRQRDQCCQYRDPVTGRQCSSRWRSEVDHHQPKWAGGSNAKSNLQLLCKNHNLYRYRQQSGRH